MVQVIWYFVSTHRKRNNSVKNKIHVRQLVCVIILGSCIVQVTETAKIFELNRLTASLRTILNMEDNAVLV